MVLGVHMNKMLKKLQQRGDVWSAAQVDNSYAMIDSGYQTLNRHLKGGLPKNGVIEVQSIAGIGELRLFMPFLLQLTQDNASHARKIVLIAPPGQVNALMFAQQGISPELVIIIEAFESTEALWAAEQCLKSGSCVAVLLWQQALAVHQVKRLKQAALQGDAVQVLFRAKQCLDVPLPVSLSIVLSPHEQGLEVEIKKQQGHWPQQAFVLDMQAQWPCLTQVPLASNVVPLSTIKGAMKAAKVG